MSAGIEFPYRITNISGTGKPPHLSFIYMVAQAKEMTMKYKWER